LPEAAARIVEFFGLLAAARKEDFVERGGARCAEGLDPTFSRPLTNGMQARSRMKVPGFSASSISCSMGSRLPRRISPYIPLRENHKYI
jgi:hypothetical protein